MSNIIKSIDEAWLGLGDINDDDLFNPLAFVSPRHDDFHLRLSWLMTKPEYFSFICKHILNISILPSQALMLCELWNRKFPMLVACRGFGKALKPNEKVRIEGGWKEIQHIEVGDKVYGSNGELCNVTGTTFRQSNLNMYRVSLRDGRQIDCCEDHMWKVCDKNKNRDKKGPIWSELTTKEMFENYFWKRSGEKSSGFEFRYAIPLNKPIEEPENSYEIHPYVLGVILGDGCITQNRVTITTADKEIIDRVASLLPKGCAISKMADKYTYSIIRNGAKLSFMSLIDNLGLKGLNSSTKFIPENYKFGSIEQRFELVRGLMDTDGYSNGQSVIEYYTISNKLSSDFLDVARSLGLHCRHSVKQSWYKGKRFDDCNRITLYTDKEVFSLTRKLSYLNHTISKQGASKYEKIFITNIEPIGKSDGHCITVDSDDKTYITKDYIVTHNSFTLALYAILRAIILQKRKIVVVGAAFRQSKIIWDYMDAIWSSAPLLRDICDSNSGPRKDTDQFSFVLNNSKVICLPLGDGTKIRGQRGNDIIADEFACLERGSLVETSGGLIRIEDFNSAKTASIITGDDRLEFETPSEFIKTPPTDVYEIKLSNGYVIRCSVNHKVMTNNGWKKPLELTNKDWVERSKNIPFGSNTNGLSNDLCWLIGLLISEGSIVDKKRISISTTDIDLVNRVVNKFGWKVSVKQAYTDNRYGWKCKESYTVYTDDEKLRESLFSLGLDYVKSHDKIVPKSILTAPKSYILSFLSGLFEGDGSCFLWKDRDVENRLGLAYYSVSERLCRDVQILINGLGYDGYINKRKSKISKNDQWFVRWNNADAKLLAMELNIPRFSCAIKECSIPDKPTHITWDKSRNKWKVSIKRAGKIVQKRFLDKKDAESYLANIISDKWYRKVLSVKKLDKTDCLYDYYLPITNSFYAEGHRQHNSIPRDIFETVVSGFGVVSSDPIENVKRAASIKRAKELGHVLEEDMSAPLRSKDNQIILSGTAYYDFNHFAAYWKKWRSIIRTKGNIGALTEIFNGEEPPPSFDWKHYSVMRIPFELLPEGFHDAAQVARSKATVHSGIYQMEYGAVFTRDSFGFFKRSLIESCVCTDENIVKDRHDNQILFEAKLIGEKGKKYIFGVDPASEVDNFSIAVLEVCDGYRKIVHCWTTTRSDHIEKVRMGLAKESDFYAYCARKIRDLMRLFPCIHIAMDAQGGGIAVMEALHDKGKLLEDEVQIWPTIVEDDPKPSDDERGLHILEMCQFAKYDWLCEANHGMRKDLEDKVLLFPRFDSVSLGLSGIEDSLKGRTFDTLEDCVMEIEELKNELSTIQMTQTQGGRDRWDTPEVIVGAGKKIKARKDRYSALLMANMAARVLARVATPLDYNFYGGFAAVRDKKAEKGNENDFTGPAWFVDGMKNVY